MVFVQSLQCWNFLRANRKYLTHGRLCCIHQLQTAVDRPKGLHPRILQIQISNFHANYRPPLLT